jgi:diamine N-acetyltransferase
VYADEHVVGHAMWASTTRVCTGSVVSAGGQRRGVGLAAMRTLVRWLSVRPACKVIRLSYDPGNVAASVLYGSPGFVATGATEGDEVVVEIRSDVVRLGPPRT